MAECGRPCGKESSGDRKARCCAFRRTPGSRLQDLCGRVTHGRFDSGAAAPSSRPVGPGRPRCLLGPPIASITWVANLPRFRGCQVNATVRWRAHDPAPRRSSRRRAGSGARPRAGRTRPRSRRAARTGRRAGRRIRHHQVRSGARDGRWAGPAACWCRSRATAGARTGRDKHRRGRRKHARVGYERIPTCDTSAASGDAVDSTA